MAGFVALQIMLLVLLAVVGGLLVWIHFKLRDVQNAQQQLPAMSANLHKIMDEASKLIKQLESSAKKQIPELEKRLEESRKTLHEFDYVLDRAGKVSQKLDSKSSRAVKIVKREAVAADVVVDAVEKPDLSRVVTHAELDLRRALEN